MPARQRERFIDALGTHSWPSNAEMSTNAGMRRHFSQRSHWSHFMATAWAFAAFPPFPRAALIVHRAWRRNFEIQAPINCHF